uniref:Uncharacterized protein n=1 Tax=Anguilla anguilla TaxID=7936 RepID=A0A0E9Q790_ANGAN
MRKRNPTSSSPPRCVLCPKKTKAFYF